DGGPEVHAGKRGQFGAGQGGPIPERFVGTTSKPKVPRERREDGPAAAEVLRPALRLARPEKKLPRLTVTAFTNLILTDQHYGWCAGLFLCQQLQAMQRNLTPASFNPVS
ncbi:hypothetical protein, partial [Pantoea agglomerans]|uniref:hypothetical protein n=1 Tax=Enterobacter agglomerans TaxID=549 RepID=UPI00301C821E